jgi:transcriptional regulator with XRE-family HTH domain
MSNGDNVGKKAVGVYTETLRDLRGFTQFDVAQRATGIGGQDYISKIERGKNPNPSLHHIAVIMRVLGGSLDHVMELLLNGDGAIDLEVARALARERIAGLQRQPTPEDTQIQEIIEKLQAHPDRLQRWIGFGLSLVDTY